MVAAILDIRIAPAFHIVLIERIRAACNPLLRILFKETADGTPIDQTAIAVQVVFELRKTTLEVDDLGLDIRLIRKWRTTAWHAAYGQHVLVNSSPNPGIRTATLVFGPLIKSPLSTTSRASRLERRSTRSSLDIHSALTSNRLLVTHVCRHLSPTSVAGEYRLHHPQTTIDTLASRGHVDQCVGRGLVNQDRMRATMFLYRFQYRSPPVPHRASSDHLHRGCNVTAHRPYRSRSAPSSRHRSRRALRNRTIDHVPQRAASRSSATTPPQRTQNNDSLERIAISFRTFTTSLNPSPMYSLPTNRCRQSSRSCPLLQRTTGKIFGLCRNFTHIFVIATRSTNGSGTAVVA